MVKMTTDSNEKENLPMTDAEIIRWIDNLPLHDRALVWKITVLGALEICKEQQLLIDGLADRVHKQSELLSRRAEK